MNLLLFRAVECTPDGLIELRDRRFEHLRQVLGLQTGDTLRVGEIGGAIGTATIVALSDAQATLRAELKHQPPQPLPLSVVLALPRPKMLRRILRCLAEVGVKDIHLVHSYRVEKSYWQSPLLTPAELESALLAGLEQAMDTAVPVVSLHRRFRPFAEDTLPPLCAGREALLAHPGDYPFFPPQPRRPGLLIIGPEGGFIPFEVSLLTRAGARPVTLGPRILRVETALHCALGPYLLGGS